MKFTLAAIALAAGAVADYPVGNATTSFTTEIVTSYTTYCPGPTEITHGTKTYTVTEATTLTITDCPCTISKPIYTTSTVICESSSEVCPPPATQAPPAPTAPTVPAPPPSYPNATVPVPPTSVAPTGAVPTTPGYPTGSESPIPTAGAGKVAALSGAGLAGLLGLAALAL
ncbi:hypothetical protein F4779DRAFT_622626 [Xylariaceae sp. FL0662B]|nr:hypothetical protein F4779DRAFT_622626 [Xylariaceae sp. FL0662B]